MTAALSRWCAPLSVTTSLLGQSTAAQLESGVRGNSPAPFGAGDKRSAGGGLREALPIAIDSLWGALAAAERQSVGRLRARSASLMINPSLPYGCHGGGARPVSGYCKVIQLE
jgi:hypothetical protein